MYIKDINLKDFRNYESLFLQFDKKVNLIVGDNGQGKTNLLEAIYITSLLKSFRTNKDSELIYFNKPNTKIVVNTIKDDYENNIDILIDKNEGKFVKVNGVKLKKASELLENVYAVIFTPDDLKIVQDEPEKRRKFIDRELCQIKPTYYSNLSNYKKVLLQRNAYLKEINVNKDVLYSWNTELAKYGTEIIHQRKNFIDKLNDVSSKIHSDITDGKENLIVKYKENIKYIENKKEQYVKFLEILNESYYNDLNKRTTSYGPHKDDLEFIIKDETKEIDARAFGSQGQQRTVALSLKLSEIDIIKEETGEDPILLLDDVLSELDLKRQEFLIKSLDRVQLFITSADISNELINKLPKGKTFEVSNGVIK